MHFGENKEITVQPISGELTVFMCKKLPFCFKGTVNLVFRGVGGSFEPMLIAKHFSTPRRCEDEDIFCRLVFVASLVFDLGLRTIVG